MTYDTVFFTGSRERLVDSRQPAAADGPAPDAQRNQFPDSARNITIE
ncbi:hypothetical protein [Amycolatopsis sp. NPDC051061]